MKPVKTISFLGAGALASGLALSFHLQGFAVDEIIARPGAASQRDAAKLARTVGATATTIGSARLDCDLLWFAVPDEAIENVAKRLARKSALPRIALHASGALSSRALLALAARGVHVGSAHPMMTFVKGEPPSLEGVWFAVEGAVVALRAARALARTVGARSFMIRAEDKVFYHAFGAMLSPMLATELVAAECIGRRAGIRPRDLHSIMEPIILRTAQNLLRGGAAKSFSGPLARGDVRTVESHLRALAGSREGQVYRALMEYAISAMPVKRRNTMKQLLQK